MKTKDHIKNSFLLLYRQYGCEQITVKKICENAHIARSTFYFYYQNIADVKDEIENEAVKGVRASCENIYSGDFENQFLRAMEYIKTSEAFYSFLVKRPDAVFIEKFKDEIIKHFKDNFPIDKNAKNCGLELDLFACAIVGCYTYYLKHPDETDIDNLSEKFRLIKNMLESYLKHCTHFDFL